uniref:Uncharacterized protein n=1 Tax=Oryza punctata TaxID=4537 RepID=A0A0E0JER6_ORYPU
MDPNGSSNRGRIAFKDITNVSSATSSQCTPSEVQRRKDDNNAKQREYRARKKAASNQVISPFVFTTPKPLSQAELLAKEKREEKNRKQREWRAKRKAESNLVEDSVTSNQSQLTNVEEDNRSEMSSIDKKREQKTKYMREWRARKKAQLTNVDGGSSTQSTLAIDASSVFYEGSLHGTVCSTILQDENVANNENCEPDEWLHRNDAYIPRFSARKASSLHQSRDGSVLDGDTQCQTTPVQTIHEAILDTDYVEFDSALFEPANGGVGDGEL